MGVTRSGSGAGWATALACAALLLASAALSYSAALTKTATIDEPNHIVSGWRALWAGDYRQDVANPPLWRAWAALGSPGVTLRLPTTGPLARDVVFAPDDEAVWSTRTLFDTPGTDGGRFVNHGRAMMLLVAVAVGAVTAGWAYRLGGPVAAVVATAGFASDPTVLAHASLIKSDLLLALALIGLAWLTERTGRRATVGRAVGLGVLCGVAVQAKFSGLLAGPVLAALLLIRTLLGSPWPAFGREARTRVGRLAVAASVGLLAAAVTVAVTWGCYRFRFRPAPSPTARMDMAAVFDRAQRADTAAELGRPPTPAEVAAHRSGALTRFARWADDHRVLPQAFLAGLVLQHSATEVWPAYLNGQVYFDGRAAYFPLAVLYKTPLPELAALALAAVGTLLAIRRTRWPAVCLVVPAALFALAALTARVNIGVRNLLPLYPFAAIAAGCVAAAAWHRRPRTTTVVCAALLGAQATTAAIAWPDYLPFFNAAVGGPRAGLARLGDSNLDWGQDVNALADWQRSHPGVPLYADLFLSVDPAFYGLDCQWLWVPDPAGRMRPHLPDRPAVIAVSATYLQGLYIDRPHRRFLATLVARPPRAVLHGTIYLYDYRP